jgi:hypothetical protein
VAAGAVASASLPQVGAEQPHVITPATNPLDHVVWWAAGTLHLPGGTMQVPDVRELVQIPGGTVVMNEQGDVRRIDDDGTNRIIGRWRTGAPRDDLRATVRAQDDGKVVWLDGTTTPRYSFVVYDPASDTLVASHPIPTGGFHETAWLNEFEDGVVYWDSPAYGQRAWDTDTDAVTKIGHGETLLVALENGIWVTNNKTGDGTEVLSDGHRLWTSSEGPWWISPDGTTVVTISTPPYQLRLRDALTGRELARAVDLPTPPGPLARVYLGDSHTVSYVVGSEGPLGLIAPYDLVACNLDSAHCTTVVEGATDQPVLPSD